MKIWNQVPQETFILLRIHQLLEVEHGMNEIKICLLRLLWRSLKSHCSALHLHRILPQDWALSPSTTTPEYLELRTVSSQLELRLLPHLCHFQHKLFFLQPRQATFLIQQSDILPTWILRILWRTMYLLMIHPVHKPASPGTWASLVPFQVSNRTPILPANVQNYSLNIIGEPFLQAETSNWGKMKCNYSLRKKLKRKRKTGQNETKGRKERKWRKKIIDQQLQHLQSLIPLRLKL